MWTLCHFLQLEHVLLQMILLSLCLQTLLQRSSLTLALEDATYPHCNSNALTVDWTLATTPIALEELLCGTALRTTEHTNFTTSEREQYMSLMPMDCNFGMDTALTEADHLTLAGLTLFHCITGTELSDFIRTKRLVTTESNFNWGFTARSAYLNLLKTKRNLLEGALATGANYNATDDIYLLTWRPSLEELTNRLLTGYNYIRNRHYMDYTMVHCEQI